MNPIYDLNDQVALVTGAGKGMGLATARMFAKNGASVVLADLDGELATHKAARIDSEGGTAIGLTSDVFDEKQVAAMVDLRRAIWMMLLGWQSQERLQGWQSQLLSPTRSILPRSQKTGANPPPGVRKFVVCPW